MVVAGCSIDKSWISRDGAYTRRYAHVIDPVAPHVVVAHRRVPIIADEASACVLSDNAVLGDAGCIVHYDATLIAHDGIVDDTMDGPIVGIHGDASVADEHIVSDIRNRSAARIPAPGKETYAVGGKPIVENIDLSGSVPDARAKIIRAAARNRKPFDGAVRIEIDDRTGTPAAVDSGAFGPAAQQPNTARDREPF